MTDEEKILHKKALKAERDRRYHQKLKHGLGTDAAIKKRKAS